MTDKKERPKKEKPVRFAIPLDASDAELQTFIDKLKQHISELNSKKIKQVPDKRRNDDC